jgi:hypothetical protein
VWEVSFFALRNYFFLPPNKLTLQTT